MRWKLNFINDSHKEAQDLFLRSSNRNDHIIPIIAFCGVISREAVDGIMAGSMKTEYDDHWLFAPFEWIDFVWII